MVKRSERKSGWQRFCQTMCHFWNINGNIVRYLVNRDFHFTFTRSIFINGINISAIQQRITLNWKCQVFHCIEFRLQFHFSWFKIMRDNQHKPHYIECERLKIFSCFAIITVRSCLVLGKMWKIFFWFGYNSK